VLALKTEFPLKFYTVLNIFFTIQDFWATLYFPWKTEGALNSQYWLYIFYHSGVLSNLRLPWKTELPWYFHCIKHVFCINQEFWVTCACHEKTELPINFSLYGITFYILNFWATCACREKQRVPWFYCTEYIFFIIQEFWVRFACPEKQSCPGIFHCIEYTLYIQEFWATCFALKNRVAQKFFAVWNILFTFIIFEQLALALKIRIALIFFTVLNRHFLLFRGPE